MIIRPATLRLARTAVYRVASRSISVRAATDSLRRARSPLRLYPLAARRHASILSSLRAPAGRKTPRRVGRGPSSGYGKTSGRGQKGLKARSKVRKGFEGGQTTLEVRRGKRGFINRHAREMATVNLDRLQEWIDLGRIDASLPITPREMIASRLIHRLHDGVKLLARGSETLRSSITIFVSRASQGAIAAVENAGGRVATRYYSASSLQRVARGLTDPIVSRRMDPALVPDGWLPVTSPGAADAAEGSAAAAADPLFPYRLPDPARRRDLEYYRDPAHRGYLVHEMTAAGEGVSLLDTKARRIGSGRKKASLWLPIAPP